MGSRSSPGCVNCMTVRGWACNLSYNYSVAQQLEITTTSCVATSGTGRTSGTIIIISNHDRLGAMDNNNYIQSRPVQSDG